MVQSREEESRHYYSPSKLSKASVLEKTLDPTEFDFTMDEPPHHARKIVGSVFAQK